MPVTGRSAAPKLAAKSAGPDKPAKAEKTEKPKAEKPADPAAGAEVVSLDVVPQEELSSAGTGRAREPAARNRNVIGSPPPGRSVTRCTGMTSCPASEREAGRRGRRSPAR